MNQSDDFTDTRDGVTYSSFTDSKGSRWLGSNLRFDHPSSKPLDSYNDDDTHGRLYSYEAAEASIPIGWRIPTVREWSRLEKELNHEIFCFPPADLRLRGSGHYYWTSSNRMKIFAKCPPGSMYHVAFRGGQMSTHSDWMDEHFAVRCIAH